MRWARSFASISLFIGAAVQLVPEHRAGFISGVLNAASSLGQFIFAPLVQIFLSMWTWTIAAASLGMIALASMPLLYWVTGKAVQSETVSPVCCGVAVPAEKVGFRHAWSSRNYRLLHLGFLLVVSHCVFGHAFTGCGVDVWLTDHGCQHRVGGDWRS